MAEETKNQMPLPAIGAQPSITKAPDFRAIYINHCRGHGTAFDIQLTCGRLTADASLNQQIEEQVTIIVAVSEAKAVRDILDHLIKESEKAFGQTPYGSAHMPGFMKPPALPEQT